MATQTSVTGTIERTPADVVQFTADMRRIARFHVPTYDAIAFNLLAAALYNARHAGEPLKTWDEIAANEITRNAYTAFASLAMRAVFPPEGY